MTSEQKGILGQYNDCTVPTDSVRLFASFARCSSRRSSEVTSHPLDFTELLPLKNSAIMSPQNWEGEPGPRGQKWENAEFAHSVKLKVASVRPFTGGLPFNPRCKRAFT